MGDDRIKHKVINATKWSSITELKAKVVTPITNRQCCCHSVFSTAADFFFKYTDGSLPAGFRL